MCTAIIKPTNVAMPSEKIFRNCFEANPDGAGYAYGVGDSFVIKKGFMTIGTFLKSVNETLEKHDEKWAAKTPMMFHFRIGTHGSNDDPKHTHPFPLSNKDEVLEKLIVRCERIVMHNGILSRWGDSAYAKKGLSDTMEFIKEFVAPIQKMLGPNKSIYSSKNAQSLIAKEVAGSRFVIMEPNGSFVYWGEWIKEDGCFYSNNGHKDVKRMNYVYKAKSSYYHDEAYWDNYCPDDHRAKPLVESAKSELKWNEMKFVRMLDSGGNLFQHTPTKKLYLRSAPYWDWVEFDSENQVSLAVTPAPEFSVT